MYTGAVRPLEKLHLEITNLCNLACPFCPPTSRRAETLPLDRFRLLLRQIEGKARVLYFHLKGEPLLHPELGSFIDAAGEAGFPVRLTTNGTLLGKRLADLVGKPNLERVNLSIHSLEALPADARPSALRELLDAAVRLRDSDPDQRRLKTVSLRLWNMTDSTGADPFLTDLEAYFGISPGALVARLSGQRGTTIRSGLSLHPAERFEWPDPVKAREPGGAAPDRVCLRGFCRALRDHAGILVDGTVVPCCLDGEGAIALGNIYAESWETILTSPRARALYDGFSRREVIEPLCRTCGYRRRF